MDDFPLDDCKCSFCSALPASSSASVHDVSSMFRSVDKYSTADDNVSSVFQQFESHQSAGAPCLGFEEWMQRAEEAADTFIEIPLPDICDDLFDDELPPHQLNAALESALLGYNLSQPSISHAAFEHLPQAAAAIHAPSTSSITSDPQEVASSSTSITNANLLDLKNIIVKKPILDKAVESLGGGKKGAQKLWGFIQVWLRHQNISPSMVSPIFSNIAANQAAAPPTSSEKLPLYEFNGHVENAAFSDVIGAAMDAVSTIAPIIVPGESLVLGTTASALAACESPTVRSSASSSATAATCRAARKRRMACKRRNLSHHQAHSARLGVSAQPTGACHDSYQHDAYSRRGGIPN